MSLVKDAVNVANALKNNTPPICSKCGNFLYKVEVYTEYSRRNYIWSEGINYEFFSFDRETVLVKNYKRDTPLCPVCGHVVDFHFCFWRKEKMRRLYLIKNNVYTRCMSIVIKDPHSNRWRETLWYVVGRNDLTFKERYIIKRIKEIVNDKPVCFEDTQYYWKISDEEANEINALTKISGSYWTIFRDALKDDTKKLDLDVLLVATILLEE